MLVEMEDEEQDILSVFGENMVRNIDIGMKAKMSYWDVNACLRMHFHGTNKRSEVLVCTVRSGVQAAITVVLTSRYNPQQTAVHSIRYDRLSSFFYLFGVRKQRTSTW